MKESTQVLLGLGLGLAGGIAIAATLNPSLLNAADAIAPVGTLWVNAIRMTVIPLVVSLVITAVASASDIKAVGRLGGRTLLVFVLLLTGTAVVVMPFGPALFRLLPQRLGAPQLPPGAAEAAGELAAGGQWQTFAGGGASPLPSDPIGPAAEGGMVPLIPVSIFVAARLASSPAPAP